MMEVSETILEAKIAERNERAKKLYRYLSDVARRITEMTSSSQSVNDLFNINIKVQRQKLRDNCEKLLFLDPINYGKKALELLWRKVYYDTISSAKKFKTTEGECYGYLNALIECGIGNFHYFIERIEYEMQANFREIDYMSIFEDDEIQFTVPSDEKISFGKSALHSCLIYLGDLSRYQVELSQSFDPSMAARYYLQAIHTDFSSGMPYNQLGNLYLDKNYNLNSVCFYIHCLSCENPFEGAMGNLTRIFEKNAEFLETSNDSELLTQVEHTQSAIVHFLSLIDVWYFDKSEIDVLHKCSSVTQQLKICMAFDEVMLPDINKNYEENIQALDQQNTSPSYLNFDLIHRIVQICLFTITKIVEIDQSKAFACKAFTLALLSQLLQKLLQQLESLGLKNPALKFKHKTFSQTRVQEKKEVEPQSDVHTNPAPITNGHVQEKDVENDMYSDENKNKIVNGDLKHTKKATAKRRRRRRLASTDSSDVSDAETESSDNEEIEHSEEEDLSDSTYQSEDDSQSDDSDCDNEDIKNETNKTTKTEDTEISHAEITNGDIITVPMPNEPNDKVNESALKRFLNGYNVMASIKLLLDWVLLEKELILSCGESGESLFQCVVNLLNIFTTYFVPKNGELNEELKIFKYVCIKAKKFKLEYKSIPLPEDISLKGTNICKFDKDATEWQFLQKHNLSAYDENIIRILNFVDFGYQLVKIVPRIRYNRTMKIFYLKKIHPPKLNIKLNHKKSREWHNSKKHIEPNEGGLPQRMGLLYLTNKVRELERSGQSQTPALLVLDSAALNKHLRSVKQLLRARNFILMVPTIVLQELDILKRDHSSARDAIRWLELQLRSGSRFLRAQRPGQSKPLPLVKCPRKAPTHIHNFIKILEFCNYFITDDKNTQGGNGDSEHLQSKSSCLILLIGKDSDENEEQYKEFSVTGVAQSAGITVENIADFHSKWRQTIPKNGKKR